MTPLAEKLLENFVWQKKRLLERAGVRRAAVPDWETAQAAHGHHMEKMADVIKDWDVDPGLMMEAAFVWARRNRHNNGPMPSMLGSAKYLGQALGFHLDLPFEAVAEKRSRAAILEKMDEGFDATAAAFPTPNNFNLSVSTSYPPVFRYVIARRAGLDDAARNLAPDVLSRMTDDRRSAMWVEHSGFTYRQVAEHFNQQSNTC